MQLIVVCNFNRNLETVYRQGIRMFAHKNIHLINFTDLTSNENSKDEMSVNGLIKKPLMFFWYIIFIK